MFADNIAAPDRVDTDLLFITLFAVSVAVIDILRICFDLCNRIRNHQCRTAGRIQFLIMVLFHDFNIKAFPENGGGFFGQLDNQIDTEGHIAGIEHRNFLCGGLDLFFLLLTVAGGADHNRHFLCQCKPQHGFQYSRIGKIHDYIRLAARLVQLVKGLGIGKVSLLRRNKVNTAYNADILSVFGGTQDTFAHFARAAGNNNLCHNFVRPFYKWGLTSDRMQDPWYRY